MAAEMAPGGVPTVVEVRGFNEAAANGRGNRPRGATGPRVVRASMRPRRMAAEIPVGRVSHLDLVHASMRPRRMAAEMTAKRGN